MRFDSLSMKYLGLFFDAANTSYAEVCGFNFNLLRINIVCRVQNRTYIINCLYIITRSQWRPSYPSTDAFLLACREDPDPLHIRFAIYHFPLFPHLNERLSGMQNMPIAWPSL